MHINLGTVIYGKEGNCHFTGTMVSKPSKDRDSFSQKNATWCLQGEMVLPSDFTKQPHTGTDSMR